MIGLQNNQLALVTFSGPESLPRLPTVPCASRKIAAAYAYVYDFRANANSPTFVDLDVCAVIADGDQETYRVTTKVKMRVPSSQIAALVFIEENGARAWTNSFQTLPDLGTP